MPVGSLRKYEQGSSLPGFEAIAGFVRIGINANWLLTGEGPMLLTELEPPPPPPTEKINEGALAAIMAAVDFARPKASPAERAATVAHAYTTSISEGLITPTGPGARAPKNAA